MYLSSQICFLFSETSNVSYYYLLTGKPAVVTLTAFVPDVTLDKVPFPDACRKLELAGAAVVGLNCTRGPETMLPLLKKIKGVCQVSKTVHV